MATMKTFELKLIGNDYDEETGKIAVSTRAYAFPVNIGFELAELEKGVQYASASHRAYNYTMMASIEGKKKIPNNALLDRLADAVTACNAYTVSNMDADVKHGFDLLAYVLDPATHTTYLNGKRVMRLPDGAVDMLNAFTAYGNGTCKQGDVKKAVVTFSEGLNKIPYLKNRTMKITDAEVGELIDMYTGKSQVRKMNKRGIEQRRITRDKLVEQVLLLEFSKVFKFEKVEKEKEAVATF